MMTAGPLPPGGPVTQFLPNNRSREGGGVWNKVEESQGFRATKMHPLPQADHLVCCTSRGPLRTFAPLTK